MPQEPLINGGLRDRPVGMRRRAGCIQRKLLHRRFTAVPRGVMLQKPLIEPKGIHAYHSAGSQWFWSEGAHQGEPPTAAEVCHVQPPPCGPT